MGKSVSSPISTGASSYQKRSERLVHVNLLTSIADFAVKGLAGVSPKLGTSSRLFRRSSLGVLPCSELLRGVAFSRKHLFTSWDIGWQRSCGDRKCVSEGIISPGVTALSLELGTYRRQCPSYDLHVL
jgi:hypothetical protein